MAYAIAADALVVLHFAFVAFAVAGAALLFVWPRIVWLHLPALAWAAYVEFSGSVCPLTPWENLLRHAAGEAGYRGSFVEHYLVALIYPAGLTRETQWLLGAALVAINAVLYAAGWARGRR